MYWIVYWICIVQLGLSFHPGHSFSLGSAGHCVAVQLGLGTPGVVHLGLACLSGYTLVQLSSSHLSGSAHSVQLCLSSHLLWVVLGWGWLKVAHNY